LADVPLQHLLIKVLRRPFESADFPAISFGKLLDVGVAEIHI